MAETKTAAPPKEAIASPPPREQVPALAPPRLPYHPLFQERFNIDRAMWKALVEAVWPLAKTPESIALALAYCQAKGRDPFKRCVHIVPMWNSTLRQMVETVWPGIADHRITAARTGEYAGADPTAFGDWEEREFSGTDHQNKEHRVRMKFPAWAQMTLYRIVKGVRVPFPGPRCYFTEYYSSIGDTGVPNTRWQRSPAQMLEKCAEAAALRKAFPEELGGEPTAEEMEGRVIDTGGVVIDGATVAPPRPSKGGANEFSRPPAAQATPAGQAPQRPQEPHQPAKAAEVKPEPKASPEPPARVQAPVQAEPEPLPEREPGDDTGEVVEDEPRDVEAEFYADRVTDLKACKTVRDVNDLREGVVPNLSNDRAHDFGLLCDARAKEILTTPPAGAPAKRR